MWWLYVLFICLFVAAVLAFFIYKKVADKKTYEKLTKDLPETLQSVQEIDKNVPTEKMEEKTPETAEKNDASEGLEDFDFEENKIEETEEEQDFSINPFRSRRMACSGGREKLEADRKYHGLENKEEDEGMDIDLFDEEDASEENSKDENADLDAKFAEYEKFLRENLGIDDDEVDDKTNDEDEFDDFSDFDMNSLKGKSKSEIDDFIKNLSPKAKEILLSDILSRKNFDDDDK